MYSPLSPDDQRRRRVVISWADFRSQRVVLTTILLSVSPGVPAGLVPRSIYILFSYVWTPQLITRWLQQDLVSSSMSVWVKEPPPALRALCWKWASVSVGCWCCVLLRAFMTQSMSSAWSTAGRWGSPRGPAWSWCPTRPWSSHWGWLKKCHCLCRGIQSRFLGGERERQRHSRVWDTLFRTATHIWLFLASNNKPHHHLAEDKCLCSQNDNYE